MLQATHYASDGFLSVFDRDVWFATSTVVRPLPQPPFLFKREHPQQSLAQHMDAIPVGSSEHPQTPDKTRSTHSISSGPASESAPHQLPTEDLPLTTGRELRPSAFTDPTPTPDDAQPAPEPLAKKSHARKQPNGHIPRPRNAFILFRCDFVAQKKIPASVEPDHRNISRIVGRIWKAMSEADRQPWVEEAKMEREKHKKLYPQYRYSPSSTATATPSTLKEKRTHYQKVRESMGVLPAWEVTSHTGSSARSSLSQPTQELQPHEVPQAEMPLRTQDVPSDVPWRKPESLDCWGSDAPHIMSGEPPSAQPVSWEALSQSQRDWSYAGITEPHHCPPHGFSTPSPSQEVVSFDIPASSSHFDSPDPSPMRMTPILPPFMFVAGHHATTNPPLTTFHYSPTVGSVSAPAVQFTDSSACVDDLALRFQSHPHDLEMNSENYFESSAWITDPIDDIIRNIESGPSLDYAPQPNPL